MPSDHLGVRAWCKDCFREPKRRKWNLR